MSLIKRCPTCKQPIKVQAHKICAACGYQITRHHKFFFREDSRVQHRNCYDPESYIKGNQ